jgi:hypothetical protein
VLFSTFRMKPFHFKLLVFIYLFRIVAKKETVGDI